MKKIALLALAAIISLSLASCGGEKDTDKPAGTSSNVVTKDIGTKAPGDSSFSEKELEITYNGVKITLGTDMNELLSDLGEPEDFSQTQSCHSDGLDKYYEYKGLAVTTYPDGDKDIISVVEIFDDTLSTTSGVKVGMTMSEVEAILGSKYDSDGLTIVYRVDDGRELVLTMDGDKVNLIELVAADDI